MNKNFIRTAPFAIGVDIGGTSTKFGVVNHRGEICHQGKLLCTSRFKDLNSFVACLENELTPIIQEIDTENIRGMGVGVPNGNMLTGSVEFAPNLPWHGIVPLADAISDKFRLPCKLTKDANAAALGELMYGSAKGMKDFIMLTLGTGVGRGVVCNGQLVCGHRGIAGELGHTVVRRGRLHWSTGLDGTLETYASATGIVNTARLLLESFNMATMLDAYDPGDITSKVVCECALKGDELCQQVFQFTGEILGEALASFVMFSGPEAIILFGGVTNAGELLLDRQ